MNFYVVLLTPGYSLSTALHITGIILLYKSKGGLLNQRLLTLNLAIAEMSFCLLKVVRYTSFLVEPSLATVYISILLCIDAILFCATRFAMLHITIDRFLDIWLNIKYPLYMSNKNLRLVMIFQWILAFIFSATHILLVRFNLISKNTVRTIRLCLDMIILIAGVLTFMYLFIKVRNILQEDTNQGRQKNRMSSIWLKFKIPMLMVATFIIFNISGSIWHFGRTNSYGYIAFHVLSICGWCSDALIYIFLQKRVRYLLPFKCCRGANENSVADSQAIQMS